MDKERICWRVPRRRLSFYWGLQENEVQRCLCFLVAGAEGCQGCQWFWLCVIGTIQGGKAMFADDTNEGKHVDSEEERKVIPAGTTGDNHCVRFQLEC